MCDTFVVSPNSTSDGSLLFGKNSDRDANEAHEVVMFPAAEHESGASVKCTHISIPQARHTHAVLLLKPFWIWGAEMGANEHGVVIGNEAVFTRGLVGKEPGLIGMDFIRLALERSASANEAVETITSLLSVHGQSGNCGFSHPLYYNNSYIIADRNEAFVVETAGREWAVERVQTIRSISNAITIGSKWDLASTRLVDQAVDLGWHKRGAYFDFGRVYSDFTYTTFSDAHSRQACTTELLKFRQGKVTVTDAFSVLRSHGVQQKDGWRPDTAVAGADVCMHVGFGPVRISQSVGSLVAHLTQEKSTFWVTGTSGPCTSIFKPIWFDGGVPWSTEPAPTGMYDPACLWWRHEDLHRLMIHDYASAIAGIRPEREEMESRFVAMASDDTHPHAHVTKQSFELAEAAEARWLERVRQEAKPRSRFYYRMAWNALNRAAKFPS